MFLLVFVELTANKRLSQFFCRLSLQKYFVDILLNKRRPFENRPQAVFENIGTFEKRAIPEKSIPREFLT